MSKSPDFIKSRLSSFLSLSGFCFIKVFLSKFFGRYSENITAIRTHYILAVLAASTNILQITAASNGLHDRKHDQHYFRTNTLTVCIYRAANGTIFLFLLRLRPAVSLRPQKKKSKYRPVFQKLLHYAIP